MKLYNQRTRQIDTFRPLRDREVSIYTCGPTVYDHAHIGNLSSYIFADTLRRALMLAGYRVQHAMNYTDIEDKIIKRLHHDFPDEEAHSALSKLTNRYIGFFLDDMQKVGNDTQAITFLKATATIDTMKELIIKLWQGGFAYIADDGVYFSIEAYRKSGKTYGQLLELTAQNTSAARIQNDEYDKESVHDFALWKKQKEGEPAWEFTIDGQDFTGRPGWHIECSVMSRQALGQPFDIHTGGIDLIFPHHENEIAQSTALEENPVMAQYFTHNNHILVDGKKMAKSAQNFYTLQDVVERGFDPLAFRLLVLQAHYRNQVNFTWESLQAAQNRLASLHATADVRFQIKPLEDPQAKKAAQVETAARIATIQKYIEDDLDMPKAWRVISAIQDEITTTPLNQIDHEAHTALIAAWDNLLGLQLLDTSDITTDVKNLIKQREQARIDKDYSKADKLRADLSEKGIEVHDTPQGPIWQRA